MNTSKSLTDILEKLHEKLLIGWIVNDGKPHAMPSHGNNDGCTAEAKKAIVEAVEGLIPEVVHKDITVWGGSKDGMRFNEDRCIGYNACREEVLQAIKEWQDYGGLVGDSDEK